MNKQANISRRDFLIGSAAVGTGLTVACYAGPAAAQATPKVQSGTVSVDWDPHAFIHVDTNDMVTVFSKYTEMGQGVFTGLATIVAEELDADWKQMRAEAAPADGVVYENIGWGQQMTGGSSSIRGSFEQMRRLGATVRQMLVRAAAYQWSVNPKEISINNGVISHRESRRSASFGKFAELAATFEVPSAVSPKPFADYREQTKNAIRLDIEAKTNGRAKFTQDFQLPRMKTAVVARPPRFGSVVASFDATAARHVNGVIDVVQIPTGVAVIAENFWAALQGRNSLEVDWDDSNAFKLSSEEIVDEFRRIAGTEGVVARDDGDAAAALANAGKTLSADFEFPYLAHATLEPLNHVVKWNGDSCEIWGGTQQQSTDQEDAAAILGIEPDKVQVHTLLAGGGYGRRACVDYAREAVEIAKAYGPKAEPIKMMWTREDDMRAGMYRPLNFHRISAGIDDEGNISGWQHTLVSQSIAAQHEPSWIFNGIDFMSVDGADAWLYSIDNVRVESHSPDLPVPVLWYRGVSATHTVFVVETFIDALAELANREPLQYRLDMLQNEPRMTALVRAVADKAGWEKPLGKSRGRGIAICKQRSSYLAQVAEVTVKEDGSYSVDRVISGIDCGQVINPDIVRAQLEGGTGFGLSSMMTDAITLREGYVQETNFDRYPLLRIDQMPDVETVIMPSDEPPTGVGEVATMAAHAAVANALHAVTGKRYYSLPIRNA